MKFHGQIYVGIQLLYFSGAPPPTNSTELYNFNANQSLTASQVQLRCYSVDTRPRYPGSYNSSTGFGSTVSQLSSPSGFPRANVHVLRQHSASQNGQITWNSGNNVNGCNSDYHMLSEYTTDDQRSQAAGIMLSNLRRFNSPSSFNTKSGASSKSIKSTSASMVPQTSYDVNEKVVTSLVATTSPSSPRLSSVSTNLRDSDPRSKLYSSLNSSPSLTNQGSSIEFSSSSTMALPTYSNHGDTKISLMETIAPLTEDSNSSKLPNRLNSNQFDCFPSLSSLTFTSSIESISLDKSLHTQQTVDSAVPAAAHDNKLGDVNLLNSFPHSTSSVDNDPVLWLSSPGSWEENNLNSNIDADSSLVASVNTNFATSKDALPSLQSDSQSLDFLTDGSFESHFSENIYDDRSSLNALLAPASSQSSNFSCNLALPASNSHCQLQLEPNCTQTVTSLSQQVAAKRLTESPSGDQQSSISPVESGYDSAELGSVLNESSIGRLGVWIVYRFNPDSIKFLIVSVSASYQTRSILLLL